VESGLHADRPQYMKAVEMARTNGFERERASEVNRLQEVREEANIRLASAATDIRGVSARVMRWAIMRGTAEAGAWAGLARGRLREKRRSLEKALYGRVKAYHPFLLAEQLAHLGIWRQP
jgi:transposase